MVGYLAGMMVVLLEVLWAELKVSPMAVRMVETKVVTLVVLLVGQLVDLMVGQ
jgi:hypothetical protein